MKIVIAGAGIGGLTAALLLHERGIECEIYEKVPELLQVGVGLALLPHAVRVYDSQYGGRVVNDDRGMVGECHVHLAIRQDDQADETRGERHDAPVAGVERRCRATLAENTPMLHLS